MKVQHLAEINNLKEKLKEQVKAGVSTLNRLPNLTKLRKLLVDSIEESDLKWFTLELRLGDKGTKAQCSVKVCSPVFVGGYFVPVTARETWDFATSFGALPLTRAVADQQVNEAIDKGLHVTPITQDYKNDLPAFDLYAEKLKATKYISEYGSNPVSGSHKVWLVSAHATDEKPVNYGFHNQGKKLPGAQGDAGPCLYSGYSVVNGLIRAHDWNQHWDYSQLLQLMKDFREGVTPKDLRQVVLDGDRAVWDEKTPPVASRLPTK